ncbi:MAG: KH domain-containing protein [Synergistaceae bacterium]|nr:KH domain-containing protein [Synergistaceae bacterium]
MPDYGSIVEYIVRRLVNQPDEVKVTSERSGAGATMVTISTAHDDIGRVIGKHGATINAIRLLAKASSVKPGEKVDVDLS